MFKTQDSKDIKQHDVEKTSQAASNGSSQLKISPNMLVPDLEHEEIERMDIIHQEDINRIKSSTPGALHSHSGDIELNRTVSKTSTKSKLSRLTSRRSKKGKDSIDSDPVPLMDLNNGIVGWESLDDPNLPQNFSSPRKYLLLFLLSSINFISPLASSMLAPAVGFVDVDLGNSSLVLAGLVVSIYVLGFSVGPLLLAPLSEIYGRRPVLSGANVFFCVWQIGCALAPNFSSLIAFRFLAGVGGSGCMTIGGGVISDLFRAHERGRASSIYSIGPLFGPIIGPICGGFVGQRIGWRWVFWLLLILGSSFTIMIGILNQETNPRILIQRKTLRLRTELHRPELQSCYKKLDAASPTRTKILVNGLKRPMKMLFFSPIIFLLGLYLAVVYGLMYLLFTTITVVFEESYGWSAEISGLAYIGLGMGFCSGLVVVAKISDATVVRMTKANSGIFEPEMRLPACIFFAMFVPISFFWYGWAAHYQAHWIVTIIGLVPFGFGMMGIFVPIQTFVIDCFPMYAASGLAALTVIRSLFGAFLPLAGPAMYESLGLGWGNSVLGFVAMGLIPAPLLIFKYGKTIREKHPIRL